MLILSWCQSEVLEMKVVLGLMLYLENALLFTEENSFSYYKLSLWGVQSSLEHHAEPDAGLSHILKLDVMEQQFSVWRISIHVIIRHAIFTNSGLNANITGVILKCICFSFPACG